MDPAESSALIRASKRAEWFWLAAIAVAAIATAKALYADGWEERKSMLLIPAIASVWYAFRRSFRKRLEKQNR
jgi:hypothetical protein